MVGIAVLVRGATEHVATKSIVRQYKEGPLVVDCQAPSTGCIFRKHRVVDCPRAGVEESSTQSNCERSGHTAQKGYSVKV